MKYKNPEIYERCKTAKTFYYVSLVIAIVFFLSDLFRTVFVISLFWRFFNYESVWVYYIMYATALFSPIIIVKPKIDEKKERVQNDLPLPKWGYCLFFLCPWVYGAKMVGACLIPHIFAYIAAAKLVKIRPLIIAEWEKDPPPFYVNKLAQKKEEEHEQNINESSTLLKKCGMKFFIKYYKQLKFLPITDIVVTENYPAEELKKRILSAKKIINSNLTEIAIKEILEQYSDFLSPEELQQAKNILDEIAQEDNLDETNQEEDFSDNLPPYLQQNRYAFHKTKGLVKIYDVTDNSIFFKKNDKKFCTPIEKTLDYSRPFQVGDIVDHRLFGEVKITSVTDTTVTVTHKNNPPRMFAINDFAENVLLYIVKKV